MVTDQNTIIHTSMLTKFYGKYRGIEDVNLDVKRGEVFGYLGPNGAGKTTTIRTFMDYIRPTRGNATIFGFDSRRGSIETRRRIGYLPGELSIYGNLTGTELLRFAANLRQGVEWSYVTTLAQRLDCDLTRRLRTLSHGNRQKIGLIQAFMHKPELVILDEPTNGLDPLIQQEFYRLILETKSDGRTVFLSSHILPEVERVCDRVGIIRNGKLAAVETVETLKSRALRRLDIHFAQAVPIERFNTVPGVRNVTMHDNVLHCEVIGSLDACVKAAAKFEVVNIVSHEPSLEEIFLAYYSQDKSNA
ncbi:MAG: ABC transporter ATP-binding protein [Dehalococcoidia bacterium]|nr:ABC transporter ATP-binding protein [Dehalococcoidia bacterium]